MPLSNAHLLKFSYIGSSPAAVSSFGVTINGNSCTSAFPQTGITNIYNEVALCPDVNDSSFNPADTYVGMPSVSLTIQTAADATITANLDCDTPSDCKIQTSTDNGTTWTGTTIPGTTLDWSTFTFIDTPGIISAITYSVIAGISIFAIFLGVKIFPKILRWFSK